MDSDLKRMVKYFNGLPKQVEALDFLENKISKEDMAIALEIYRQAPKQDTIIKPLDKPIADPREVFKPDNLNLWLDMDYKLTTNFSVGEVVRYDYDRIPHEKEIATNLTKIVKELQKIRDAYSKHRGEDTPFKITSGYRPPAVNRAVGGAKQSRHIYGTALDVIPQKGKPIDFERWLDGNWSGGLGYGIATNKGFTHIDLNFGADPGFTPGRKWGRRWNY